LLLRISTVRTTLADQSNETARRKPLKGGQKERRIGKDTGLAGFVKTFQAPAISQSGTAGR